MMLNFLLCFPCFCVSCISFCAIFVLISEPFSSFRPCPHVFMSSCLWTPTFIIIFFYTTSTCLLLPPSISFPSLTTLFMSKSLSVFHSIYRFLLRRTGMWCCITAWPPPLRGRRSTLSHSWHLATMCSSIYLLPSWLRASRPRWVVFVFFSYFVFCWNDNFFFFLTVQL